MTEQSVATGSSVLSTSQSLPSANTAGRSVAGSRPRARRARFLLRLILAFCGVLLTAFFPRWSAAQQINYSSFNIPQAATPSQISVNCPAETNILFCFNYSGAGPSFFQDFYAVAIDPNAATDGGAGSANYALLLTQNAGGQDSSVWFAVPQDVVDGFTTWYAVKINYQGGGDGNTADGLAFVIQNALGGKTDSIANCPETGLGPSVLGYGGGCLGYGGIDNSVALEMDTFYSSWDPQQLSRGTSYSDNHLALQGCGLDGNGNPIANSPTHTTTPNCLISLGGTSTLITSPVTSVVPTATSSAILLSDGNTHQIVMVYNGPNDSPANYLWVYLDATYNPGTHTPVTGSVPMLSGPFDITQYIKLSNGGGSYSPAYVGFTAATGGDFEQHEVMGWTFASHAGPQNFGNVNECPLGQSIPVPCNATLSVPFQFPGLTTIGSIKAVTQGTSGLDFTVVSGGTCGSNVTTSGCTVNVTFAPLAPGLRRGAVQIFDTGGNLLASTLIYGTGQGPAVAFTPSTQDVLNTGSYTFNQPKGLTTDAAGNLYVADTGGHNDGYRNVLKIAPDGTQTVIGSGLPYPQGIAVDGAGNLYVADNDLNQVLKIPVGCTSSSCQQALATPQCVVNQSGLCAQLGVAVDGPGNVFIASFNSQVIEVPSNGGAQTVLYSPVGSHPVGIAVDSAGDLFISDVGLKTIVKVPAGCTSASCQTLVGSGWNQPNDVAVDAAGDVFVTDADLQQVVEVPAGCTNATCQIVLASGIVSAAVTVDVSGNVYAVNLSNNTIVEINRSQPPSVGFANLNVGNTSSPVPLTFQNIGNQPLNAESPRLIAVNGPNFINVPGTGTPVDCSASSVLPPGQVCNLGISFSPQASGPLSSTAVFTDNSLNAVSATQTIALSGTGVGVYTVGGTASGLNGGTAVLQDNLGDNLSISGNGLFTFQTSLVGGSPYSVTVLTQPLGQVCTVTNGSGSVGVANITNVQVSCANIVNYVLTVTDSGTGTGTVADSLGQISCYKPYGAAPNTCSASYAGATLVTLTANPSNSDVFAGWGGACSSSGAIPSCTVTLNSALNVTATFVAPPTAQPGTLAPITAGVVYGQSGSFTSNTTNNGGVSANSLNLSQGMFVDNGGNLYVSDGNNNRVLFYPSGSTTATRVYGQNGSFTSNGSNNGGISANSLSNPQGVAVDSSGDVYISDQSNSRVLFYPTGSTTATRVYGQPNFTTGTQNTGGVSATSLSVQIGIALDNGGNLYVADYGNSRVVFYPAGSTTATRVYGQGGSFTSNAVNNGGISANSLNQPQAVALDSSGDLYVADIYNNRVLFYPANSSTATRVYGQNGLFTTGTANNGGVNAGTLNNPLALTVDSNGGLYVVDRSNNRVLYYPFNSGSASRVYGQSGSFNANSVNNGGVSANSLNQPWGLVLDQSGNVYIADYANNRVLEYGSFANVNACPANQGTPAPCNKTVTYSYAPTLNTTIGAAHVVTQGVTGLDFTLGSGNTCTGTILEGSTCTVNVNFAPLAPGLRAGAMQMFDNTGSPLASTPIYGIGQGPVIAYGSGTQTVLLANLPTYAAGVAVDAAGNVFVAGGLGAVKLTPSGIQTTFPVSGLGAAGFYDVAVDGAGDVYLADSSNNRIVEIAPSGVQTTVPATGLNFPSGVKVDGLGNVFITDRDNNRVVKITPSGVQTTVPTTGLVHPYYPAVDAAGDIFFLDNGSQRVLKVTPGGVQSTVPFSGLSATNGLAVDAAGDVYVSDQVLNKVFEITPGGVQTTVISGSVIVPAGLAVDASGNLFVAVNGLNQVVELSRSQTPSLSFATTNVGSLSLDSPQTISLQNVGNQPLTGTPALNLGGNFTQSSSANCPGTLTLVPGAICGQSFSFTPQSATFLSGSVVYTDNNLNGSPATQTITLSGTGAIGGVAGTVAVPNVVGQVQTAVAAPITAAGLTMGTVTTASNSTVPSGSIISQSPAAGTQVAVGSAVNLLVSSGIAQPVSPNPLSLENNYFVTGDYVSAAVTLRTNGTGNITIPRYTPSAPQGVPDGADIVDAFLYWETLEKTPFASSTTGNFNGYPIVGQQIGTDLPNYVDGQITGTMRAYRASVNAYLPVGANGVRIVSGSYSVVLPSGGAALPLTEGASLVMVYRVLSPNFPLKSVIIYDGAAAPTVTGTQVVQGFYDAVGGANGTGKNTNIFASGGTWSSTANSVPLGSSSQFSATLNTSAAYAAVILSTPVNNSDNDGILDAWKTGPASGDFHAGQPGYYDVKTGTWVGLPGAKHGQKDLFVQLDYMCGAILATGACDPAKENLFPSPDVNGNDPLAMVQQAFTNSGVQLHLQVGNAVPEDTCVDDLTTTPATLCQFPNQPGVVGWKNSLEFSKLYPRNLAACLTGGDCTTRFPYGQKDSYHYVLFGHSLAIPGYNTRYGTLTSIEVANGVTTIGTVDRGAGSVCPIRITLTGVIGDPALNGVYTPTGCADTKTITLATPGVPNYNYPNNILPEPVIGLTSGTVTSISGYSDLGGADSAVTLGLWLTAKNQDMSKRANVIAGTLFHEIGHTLGLSHGGLYYDTPNSYVANFEGNCKPNYQSVMNYLFQLDLLGLNQTLAFSNQTLNTVNENSAASTLQLTDLSNNPATFPTSAWYVPYTIGSSATPAVRHCDGTPLAGDSAYRVDAPIAPITPSWSSPQDLSFTGVLQSSERGFNDLANMDLRQVGATGGEFASLASVLSFGTSVAPLNIGAGQSVTLGGGGTVALGSGGSVTLSGGSSATLGSNSSIALMNGGAVTLGNGGTVSLNIGGMITPGAGGIVTLGSGGTVKLNTGSTLTAGSDGIVAFGSGGIVTLGSGGIITLGSGGIVTVPPTGGTYNLDSRGGIVTLGSGGIVTLGSGGIVTLGSGGIVTLGSGGIVTLGSGGIVTLGSGGIVTLGSGGIVTLGSGGVVTLGSGGIVTLGSGGIVTLGSGGIVALGSGGTVTLGTGGSGALASGGIVTLGSGGSASLGAGGTVTLTSGGSVSLNGGTQASIGSGGIVTLGSGGIITFGSGGIVTLGSGGIVTLGSGGVPFPVAAGGIVTLGSGGTVAFSGSGGIVTLGSGGIVTLGSGGIVTLGSGGIVTLGSGGVVTLGSGGVVTLGSGGTVTLGSGSDVSLGTVNNITPASGGPSAANELTYETANSVVRPPSLPAETVTPAGFVRITWKAPAFGVVQTYTIYRSSNGAMPIVIGSVSGVNGNPPATEFTDTNPDRTSQTVVYTISTLLVPDAQGTASRQSQPSPPAVIKNDQSIALGPLPSSITLGTPLTVTATAMSGGIPNGLQVAFSATGPCAIGSQSIASNVSSAVVALSSTGSCTVIAAQPGSTSFNAANSASGTFMVLPQNSTTQSQTITFAPLQSAQYGGSFLLSASSSSGATVNFTASGPCTKSGTITGVGVCSITASAPGSSTYSPASLTQSFNIYPAVLTVTANNLTSTYGQPLPPLTYAYGPFVKGDTVAVVNGAPVLSTTATSTSNAGSYLITVSTGTLATANYSFLYVTGTLTVQQANQSALLLTTTSPLAYGQSETLSIRGGTTGGVVTYAATGPCSISGARLTASSGIGACLVTATMAGNGNYNAVTSAPANVVTLAQLGQTITFTTNPPASAAYRSTFTVAATGGPSGNPVTFTSAGACSNAGATYTMTNSTGICSVIANQAGNLNYTAAAQVTKTVAATGPLLSVSTSSINFGTVYAGSISAQIFTITNTGTSPATINDPFISIVKGGNSNEFVALSLCPKPLAVGKSCTVLIGFIAGPYYTPQTATLQIMSNAPDSPQPVALSAAVINPQASFSSKSLSFGTVKHATSSTLNVTLSNPGGTPLILSGTGIKVTGANATSFVQTNNCGSSVAAGAGCTIVVKFTPPATGTFSATLTVADNAQTGTQTVPLTGTGN